MMKVFVIFLCMVIGYSSVDLQRVEIGEDDLKANENAMEAASLDARETNNQDQYIRWKDVHAAAQSVVASSNETETYEKPPPSVVKPMTEERKSGQRAYFGRRVMYDIRSLLKHFRRHISAEKAAMEVKRSFPETSAAIRYTDTSHFAIKIRKLFRTKRSADRDEKRSKFAPFQIFGNILEIRKNIPIKMMKKVYASNDAEARLLDSLAASNSAPADVLNQYKAAKNLERQTLKETVAADQKDAAAIIGSYKVMIKDGAYDDYLYDHFKLREKHAEFFDKPSAALREYNNLKRQEVESLDSFLKGSNQALYKSGNDGILNGNGNTKPRPHSKSHSSQMQAKVFVICLCMVIVYAVGDLQRVEIGEDDLKANENAMEAASLDARERNNQDQYIRWKDVHASAQSVVASSNETETYEKPPPSVVTPMTVTSEGKKNGHDGFMLEDEQWIPGRC